MIITVMAKSLNLTYLINHLIHEESDEPNNQDDDSVTPLSYVYNRSLFQKLRELYESRLLVEFCEDEPPDIDDVGTHHLDASIMDLINQTDTFMASHEIIAAIPLCAAGNILLVMTTRR